MGVYTTRPIPYHPSLGTIRTKESARMPQEEMAKVVEFMLARSSRTGVTFFNRASRMLLVNNLCGCV